MSRALRRAGAVVARRGRGDTPVPEAFRRLGVTSREVDVLVLVGERGVAQDGSAVELAGTTADVVQRQRDGTWLVAIDSPLGGA